MAEVKMQAIIEGRTGPAFKALEERAGCPSGGERRLLFPGGDVTPDEHPGKKKVQQAARQVAVENHYHAIRRQDADAGEDIVFEFPDEFLPIHGGV